MNLYGAPTLSGKQYAAYRAKMDVETIVGAGLAVRREQPALADGVPPEADPSLRSSGRLRVNYP